MCKKTIYLISLVFVLSMAANASADLILHWPFDEGSGNTATDRSGNGRDGTLVGNPAWVAGKVGGALDFGGDGGHVIDDDAGSYMNGLSAFTVALWIKSDAIGTDSGFIIFEAPEGRDTRNIRYDSDMGGGLLNGIKYGSCVNTGDTDDEEDESPPDVQTTEWQHVCVTWQSGAGDFPVGLNLYIDGVLQTPSSDESGAEGVLTDYDRVMVGKGGKDDGATESWDGLIDDVRIYDHVLTVEEIQAAMIGSTRGYPYALGPDPEDGALYANYYATPRWKAGDFAVTHDVYFSDNYDDVNDGTDDALVGNLPVGTEYFLVGFPNTPIPDGLAPGTTYYWRIDEVNDADPNSPWKGRVWSFSVPSDKAHDPVPGDSEKFVDPENVNLTWTIGFEAILHTVYFGDDFDEVSNVEGGLQQAVTTFSPPGPFEADKTYYWRVDEFDAAGTTHKGDVWSFSIIPEIPITDPNLVGWWKFEAGAGTKVIDFSGHGNHGTMAGAANMQWIESLYNLGLEFLGDGQGHVELPAGVVTSAKGSILMWVNTTQTSDEGHLWWMCDETGGDGGGGADEMHITIEDDDDAGKVRYFWEEDGAGSDISLLSSSVADGSWYHVAATWDLADGCRLYVDGVQVGFAAHNTNEKNPVVMRLGHAYSGSRYYDGLMDDVRLFDYAISAAQLNEIMNKGEDPLRAGNPSPRSNSLPGVDEVSPLSWSPGESASQHDVYFGTDKDAVKAADASDTTGVYRGTQNGTTFTPAEPVEWGTGPYYWRIDEINADGTISKGSIWTFTVADFILIDDFEDYNIGDNEIWYSWHDGLGAGAVDLPGYVPGNGTGSEIGDGNTGSYTEETIVHGGSQSMPYWYNNNKQGFNKYSEAELTLSNVRDWTAEGVAELSLWFRGNPVSVGSFVEGPIGTYTMTATGRDIDDEADEFHYAYKMLNGAGSIIARVESVEQTDDWAKAGVMIRETLDAGSKFAAVFITPTNADGTATNGCRFQARLLETGGDATSDSDVATDEQTAIVAPYWIKLERDVAGNFSGFYSSDGSSWRSMFWNPQNISMTSDVYVGLALTSHNNDAVCTAVFSNVTINGSPVTQWANQDIGIESNVAEPLYVAVSNSAGLPAVVYHDDPAATNVEIWTEWPIPLQDLVDLGLNLADVDRIAIGVGTRGNTTIPGGLGKMYFDDIRLYRSREAVVVEE